MNIDFDIAFLYYQELAVLDGQDPKMEELRSHIDKFKKYVESSSLSDLLKLICISYKSKYGQESYWYTQLLIQDAYKIEAVYPSDLDEDSDLYLPEEKMIRKDLKHLILKRFDDFKNNAYLLKEMEIVFKESQDQLMLAQSIEGALGETSFMREDTLEETVFTVTNSPIASITINASTFIIVINQDKWIEYR
ncbi:hypothetical protein [uncultured Dokdonia sp.]|uniref:hypothetical protein n=1 Tax=uncultured Dokdonia sp. TaxID=575653 RepID=UPI00261E50F9|nr:hypothetical protein [uncultured Dokdonia sp.]